MQEILILEPNRETARQLRDHFEAYGFTVVCVETVDEGITALSDHPPDLIVSEFRLPGNDLERLCRFIGKEGEQTTIPLLFTTAAARSPRIQQEVKRIGADAILYKPFSFQTLLERIERIRVGRRFYRKSRITLGKEERWEEIPLSGSLARCGFPELIRLIRLGGVSGALTLEKAHAFRVLYWKGGELIAITETFSRSENLGAELLQEGRISNLQYEHLFSSVLSGREALLDVPEDPENHALHLALEEAIAAKGWIAPHELHEAATRRLRRKFIGIWGWRQGFYRVTRQSPPPFTSMQGSFDLPGLVFEAIGRFGNFAELRRRTRDWDRV
ncbi:MAG: response regulator, partial [Deltaproteobacteria bacterium]